MLEFNAESEPPFLVLELLSGEDLSQWMLRPHRLREQLQVLTDMARGLDAAHRAGILHRDLKPDNVRVLDDGHAKLLDFGIAQAGHSGLTAAGYFVGTPSSSHPR
ncbi:MAG: protein kinase [Lysobacterales bacterium]